MSIWVYKDFTSVFNPPIRYKRLTPRPSKQCPACETSLILLGQKLLTTKIGREVHIEVWVCQTCGWWSIGHHYAFDYIDNGEEWTHYGAGFAHGSLKNLDLSDIRQPLEEVSRYLMAKNNSIGAVNPRLAEEVVASVFQNLGYRIELTPLVGDDGIDVYILNNDKREIGIQVKRWNHRVSVEPIRAFLGALMLKKLTKGILIATGGFTSGAEKTAALATNLGFSNIKLRDSSWLLDTLKLTQRNCYEDMDDPDAPFHYLLNNAHKIPAWDMHKQFD
ncbi:MAG: restriction endonuclease [Candidatus Zixiibacteriota bacterium]